MLKVVLDTNALIRCLSRRSAYTSVIDKLRAGDYDLFLTSDILLEYEEIIARIFSRETAELVTGAFTLLPNVHKIEIHYRLNLITKDMEDNKFSDCAFAANAHYLVTNDNDFNVIKSIPFPRINIITLEEFSSILND